MASENSPLPSQNEINECSNGEDINGNDNFQPPPIPQERSIGTDKITLTSRKTKKRVTINVDPNESQEISNVEEAVSKLENDFSDGVEEIRKCLRIVASNKHTYELHIKSLEESLRKSTAEKEKYIYCMEEMKKDIEILTRKLEGLKKDNNNLNQENQSLQSDHESHLNSIADQYHRNRISKKTFTKWRSKLRTNQMSSRQIGELVSENERLKSELIAYQESTKHAFLRSANMLNSEVVNLFQSTATRRLNSSPPDSFRDSNSDVSSVSDHPSCASGESNVNKENARRPKKCSLSKGEIDLREERRVREERTANWDFRTKSHSDNELNRNVKHDSRRNKTVIRDFVPDSLRRETRQIMKQLETNRSLLTGEEKRNAHKDNVCNSKAHVHICHCAPLPDKPGNCPYCYAHQNYNFAKMPIGKQNVIKTSTNFESSKRERNSSLDHITGERSKVIFKPSGSTVVIEKHLGR